MNYTLLLLLALAILLTIGVSIWVALMLFRVSQQLRTFAGFEGMHFENCSPELSRVSCRNEYDGARS